ncbi:GNAT family N-acetyltransferase [Colwellia sp. E2M01]|nr:GNAT family N-acetyltransferase [Colwellia sp. E2M01]
MIVLSGEESWANSLLNSIENFSLTLEQENTKCLIYGDSSVFKATIQKKRFRDYLGTESDFIIFADSQFTIDAFAALSGILKAGGVMFLITSSFNENIEESLFFKRFYSLVKANDKHTVITQSQVNLSHNFIVSDVSVKALLPKVHLEGCITNEQYEAVTAIKKVVSGHRKRPLVLTADRGRGKSSALAIACAQLMQVHSNDDFNVLVSAPDIQSLSVFYRQLKQSLSTDIIKERSVDNAKESIIQQGNTILFGKANLRFIPVDQLIKSPVKCNLLVVDEAAAIPVYLLEQLLSHYHRMVFSSTVHGYEGAGRSFTLKFQKTLNSVCPQWTSLHVNQPIRWREDDPLEQLVFEACLLNAELPNIENFPSQKERIETSTKIVLDTLSCRVISAEDLVNDEVLLKQVFAILVTAHYQTKPSDLKLMLDNPQVQVACLFSGDKKEKIIGVALLMTEGANSRLDKGDISNIKQAKRRLPNHFLPQSLLTHCGFEAAFNFQYLRIMRIAIHPRLQQQGIGSHFMQEIELLAKKQNVDFIGASFGANSDLLAFWLNAKFTTVRIGFTKDKASGENSALVLKGLNEKAITTQDHLSHDFYRSFDYLLLDEYKTLAPPLVHLLLTKQVKSTLTALRPLDLATVKAYSTGERLFSSCVYSLYLWFKQQLLEAETDIDSDVYKTELMLITRLIQKHDSETVCKQYGYSGKKMLDNHIKGYVNLCLLAS